MTGLFMLAIYIGAKALMNANLISKNDYKFTIIVLVSIIVIKILYHSIIKYPDKAEELKNGN